MQRCVDAATRGYAWDVGLLEYKFASGDGIEEMLVGGVVVAVALWQPCVGTGQLVGGEEKCFDARVDGGSSVGRKMNRNFKGEMELGEWLLREGDGSWGLCDGEIDSHIDGCVGPMCTAAMLLHHIAPNWRWAGNSMGTGLVGLAQKLQLAFFDSGYSRRRLPRG